MNLQIKRYTGGLGALLLAGNWSLVTTVQSKHMFMHVFGFAETSVNSMKEELIALQPGLVKAKEDTAILTKQVEEAIPGVDAQKAVAMKDEEATAKQAAEVQKVKDECEADLAKAIPILKEALSALDTITKKDLDEVKAMGKPPDGVRLAMTGYAIGRWKIKILKKNKPKSMFHAS